MPREKKDYREQYALMLEKIDEKYPDNMGYLTAEQVAEILGIRLETVYRRSNEKMNRDPIPRKKIGKSTYRYPVASFVRWSLGA